MVLDVVLREKPADIDAFHVTRIRKATTLEFQSALNKLRNDHEKLNATINKASRIAGLAQSSVEGFQALFAQSRASFDPESMTVARLRWIKAARKVILLV